MLEERLQETSQDLSKYQHDTLHVIDTVRNFTTLWPQANNIEKIKMLRTMADWIIFDGEKARIEWKKQITWKLQEKTYSVEWLLITDYETDDCNWCPLECFKLNSQIISFNIM